MEVQEASVGRAGGMWTSLLQGLQGPGSKHGEIPGEAPNDKTLRPKAAVKDWARAGADASQGPGSSPQCPERPASEAALGWHEARGCREGLTTARPAEWLCARPVQSWPMWNTCSP